MTRQPEERLFDLKGRKVVVAIPTLNNQLHIKAAGALVEAGIKLASHGVQVGLVFIGGCSIISKGRNALVQTFLEMDDATDLIFLDADMGFTPNDLVKLVAWGCEHDIVCGVAQAKLETPTYRADILTDASGAPVFNAEGTLVEMERVGTAFMLIRRHVFSGIVEHGVANYKDTCGHGVHAFFDIAIKDGKCVGEDYAFCDLARAAGYKVYCDPGIVLSHFGEREFTGSFGDDVLAGMLREKAA